MNSVLITGTSRGIGRATAEYFLRNDWQVCGTSTSGDSDLKHQNYVEYKLDLSSKTTIENFVKQFGQKVDVLINNGAISLEWGGDIEIEKLRKTLEVNLIGTISLTESFIEKIETDGVIINISSGLGSLTDATSSMAPEYSISKAALNMYTRKLYNSQRIKSKNISVFSYEPGWVRTDMGGSGAPRSPELPAKELFDLVNSGEESGQFYNGDGVRSW